MKALIIGPGRLGCGIAAMLLRHGVEELFLYGRNITKTAGIAADLCEIHFATKITVLNSLQELPGADISFLTTSTLQWNNAIDVNARIIEAKSNMQIIADMAQQVSFARFGTLIIVSNPVDILVRFCHEQYNAPDVYGFGNTLDELRIGNTLSSLNMMTDQDKCCCIGEHGAGIVPLLSQVVPEDRLEKSLYHDIVQQTFQRTQQVIRQAFIPVYAPLMALEKLLQAIFSKNEQAITLSTYLYQPAWGVSGLALGVPVFVNNDHFKPGAPPAIHEWEQELFHTGAQRLNNVYRSLV